MLVKPRFKSIQDIRTRIDQKQITLPEVVQHYLNQIDLYTHTNAWIEVWKDEAMQRAQQLQKARNEGKQLPLFGAVLSLKDNICYTGHTVTAASKILEGYEAIYTATAVQRLLDAGAIILGRTNCDQFGMGSSNENSVYGPVRNGANAAHTSGGSSGGGAVAVQTHTCIASIGSDTGGSVRQPAAFCGVYGLKPTYGRISRYGLIAYGSSFDQIGIMANNSQDIALLLSVMAGHDPLDATSAQHTLPPISQSYSAFGKYRIATIAEAWDTDALDPEIRAAAQRWTTDARQQGAIVEEVSFPLIDYIIPAYYVLTTAEASSNLARYDGVRYGYRAPEAQNLEQLYLQTRTAGFSDEVKRRILLGTFVLSSGYYDAYYTKAQQARRLIRDNVMRIFQDFDFILLPAAPTVAWPIGKNQHDPVASYLADIYTVLANLSGVPALAFPVGQHPKNNLPIGLQLMAKPWCEMQLLQIF